jgi:hypothetical protein
MDEVEVTVRVGVRTRVEAIGDSLLIGGVRIQFTNEAGAGGRVAKTGGMIAELAELRKAAEDELRAEFRDWTEADLAAAWGR